MSVDSDQWWETYVGDLRGLPEWFAAFEDGDFSGLATSDEMADRLTDPVTAYLERSALPVEVPGDLRPAEAGVLLDQVCWSVRVDVELARSLLLLADFTSDQPAGLAEGDPWIAVRQVVAEVIYEFGSPVLQSGGQYDPSDRGRVRFAATRITAAGGDGVGKVIMALGGSSAVHLLTGVAGQVGAGLIGSAATEQLAALTRGLGRLATLALNALIVAVNKLLAWVGIEQLLPDGEIGGRDVVGWLVDRLVDFAAGRALGQLIAFAFDRDEVVSRCSATLNRRPYDWPKVEAAALEVVRDHKRRQLVVEGGSKALGCAMKLSVLTATPVGIPALVGVGVVLALFSLWLTHDALDASRPGFLPDRIEGLHHRISAIGWSGDF